MKKSLIFILISITLFFPVSSLAQCANSSVDFTELTVIDSDHKITSITSERIDWTKIDCAVNRSMMVFLGPDHLSNFTYEFDFQITEIKASDFERRDMLSIWAVLRNNTGEELSKISLYCEQIENSLEYYRTIFRQGGYNKDMFVDISRKIFVNETYYARIQRVKDRIRYTLYSDPQRTDQIHDSDWQVCGYTKFEELSSVSTEISSNYPNDYCSGFIQNMRIQDSHQSNNARYPVFILLLSTVVLTLHIIRNNIVNG